MVTDNRGQDEKRDLNKKTQHVANSRTLVQDAVEKKVLLFITSDTSRARGTPGSI